MQQGVLDDRIISFAANHPTLTQRKGWQGSGRTLRDMLAAKGMMLGLEMQRR